MRLLRGTAELKLSKLVDKSVDLVLTDPPYGMTNCKWDEHLDWETIWQELTRIRKDNAAIVLMSMQPFTTDLILSNRGEFRYLWTWYKENKATGFLNANKQPLRVTEDVLCFYKKQPTYNPQMVSGKRYNAGSTSQSKVYGKQNKRGAMKTSNQRFPTNVINISSPTNGQRRQHATQKPVALSEYLIKTYSNVGDTVLDFTMGSGTTGIACKNLGREFIGIESDPEIFERARQRIERHHPKASLL